MGVVSTSSPRSATRRTATTASRLRAARSATLLAVRRSSYSPVLTPVLARTHAAPLSCSNEHKYASTISITRILYKYNNDNHLASIQHPQHRGGAVSVLLVFVGFGVLCESGVGKVVDVIVPVIY